MLSMPTHPAEVTKSPEKSAGWVLHTSPNWIGICHESIDLQEASHGDHDMQENSSIFNTQEFEDCLLISTCNV